MMDTRISIQGGKHLQLGNDDVPCWEDGGVHLFNSWIIQTNYPTPHQLAYGQLFDADGLLILPGLVDIHGDAYTWWGQAKGHYARGFAPKLGAVMALQPHGNSRLGHVAAVSRIIDDRTILIRHANWSLIHGRRGQIEDNVRAVDVSPGNDWSEVRMWYAPIHALGGSHWPVQGFIYQGRAPETSREANRPSSHPLPALHLAYAPRHHEPAMRPLAAPVRHSGLSSHRLAPRAGRDPIGELIGARLGI